MTLPHRTALISQKLGQQRSLLLHVVHVVACLVLFSISSPSRASTYLKLDENGRELWVSHPTEPGFQESMTDPYPPSAHAEAETDVRFWKSKAPHLSARAKALRPLIRQSGLAHGVDAACISALIEVESGFNERAVSPKGARGLMQIMPSTALEYGVRDSHDLINPKLNLEVGVRHLRDLLNIHGNNWALALAAYNAGQTVISRQGSRIPRYRETMLYVPAILSRVEQHRAWLNLQD